MDNTLQGINPYSVLGVLTDATTDQIHAAYLKLAKTKHPDKGGDSSEFATLEVAHRLLMNEQERAYYDRTGQIRGQQSIDKDAGKLLQSLFKQLMDKHGAGIFYRNVVEEMRDLLIKGEGVGKRSIHEVEKNINHLKKLRDHWQENPPAPPLFTPMITQMLQVEEANREDHKYALDTNTCAQALLKNYSFKIQQDPATMWKNFNYNPVTVTPGSGLKPGI